MDLLSMYGYGDDEDSADETGTEPGTTRAAEPAESTDTAPIVSLFNKYYGSNNYATKLEEARRKREQQLSEYQKVLEQSAAVGGGEPSKAEMYFRLASAFAEPGKTGDFWESLGRAGKTMGEYEKESRLARRERELAGLKAKSEIQKLGIEATGDEMSTLQALAEQEMKDKTKLFEEIAKSMKPATPSSPSGKIAADEGLTPGTDEFKARVQELETERAAREQSRIDVLMSNLGIAQANLGIAQAGAQAKREALSPNEIKEVWKLEDEISAGDTSLSMLQKALEYSKISFALDPTKNASEWAQYQTTQQRDPKNKRVIATNYLRNLLSRQSLESLKATFGGAGITDSERAALLELQGMSGASPEERALIINNTISLLKQRLAKNKRRMQGIYAGEYTRRPPATGAQ